MTDNGEQDKLRDKYKEIELKYKRFDVFARGIGAFAAIASAIAAFLAIRGYTGSSTPTLPPSTTTPAVSSPASPTPSKASVATPTPSNSPSIEALNSPSSNQSKPATPKARDDDDDFDEDD